MRCENEVADLKARNADADERIERLTQILKAFDRARFGRRSEKLGSPTTDDEQQAFVFEEIETGIAAIRAKVNKGRPAPRWQTSAAATQGLRTPLWSGSKW
jgi:transposase